MADGNAIIIDIDLDKIDLGERLREVDNEHALSLSASMKERGLLHPVEVREAGSGRYKITVGAHRLAAAQMLAWPSIRAVVENCNEDEARLREIDENLYRHELTPYDQANFLKQRKDIWERLHGRVKPGPDKRKSRQLGAIEVRDDYLRFYKEVEGLFAIPKRTVQRALERQRNIHPEIWAALKGTKEAQHGALLDKLAKVAPDDQPAIFAVMKERGSTLQYAMQVALPAPQPSADERVIKSFIKAWRREDYHGHKQARAAVVAWFKAYGEIE